MKIKSLMSESLLQELRISPENFRKEKPPAQLSKAGLDFLAGIPGELTWRARGLDGHESDESAQAEFSEKRKAAQRMLETAEGKFAVQRFIDSVDQVFFRLISGDRGSVQTILPETEFHFVLGHARTGGTFLFTELSRALGFDYKQGLSSMLHDSIPEYTACMLWRSDRAQTWNFLYELAVFLTYLKLCGEPKKVVQKRIAFSHSLEILDYLFDQQAQFHITYRHPGPANESFLKMGNTPKETWTLKPMEPTPARQKACTNTGLFSADQYQGATMMERLFMYWYSYHYDLAKGLRYLSRPASHYYFQSMTEDIGRNFRFEPNYQPSSEFRVSSKSWGDSWPSEDFHREQMNRVEKEFKASGVDLKPIELI